MVDGCNGCNESKSNGQSSRHCRGAETNHKHTDSMAKKRHRKYTAPRQLLPLVRHHRTPHGHTHECRYVTKNKNCNCMTKAEHQRYLAWLESATNTAL